MAKKRKPYDPRDVNAIRTAIVALKEARADLKAAGAVQSVEKVRSALKSADGALRHAVLRQYDR